MIDWLKLKPKCPKCDGEVDKTEIFKQYYKNCTKGLKRVEARMYRCKVCKYEFWKP